MPRQALGRGLNALIPGASGSSIAGSGSTAEAALGPAQDVLVAAIRPNPYQPRLHFSESELADLARSIQAHGILQPLLVVRHGEDAYELVSGERRLRAVRQLGWTRVPAVVKDSASPREMAEWAIIENVQRDDLGPLEQARAYRRLMDEFKLSADEVAQKVGRDRSTIANVVRLLKLDPAVQALVEKGELQMGHARALLAVDNEVLQKAVALKAAREGWSVRQVEQAGRGSAPAKKGRRTSGDPNNAAVEERLRRKLGTKVRLIPSGKGGRLEIHYYGAEELERLLDLLG
ncbi:MAG: ParB/RepB/Spo0J family partition protein [bacterium]